MKRQLNVEFDANNVDHLNIYDRYRVTNSWGNGCPFYLEWPYTDVPTMIAQKIITRYLCKIINDNKTRRKPK
jgi:hypothetical protein